MKKVILEGVQTRSLTIDEWKVLEEALSNVKDISVITNSKLDEEKLIAKTIAINEELKVHFLEDNVLEKAKKAIFALLKKIKKATISAFALMVAVFETLLIMIEAIAAFLLQWLVIFVPFFWGGYLLRSRTLLRRKLRREKVKIEMGFYSPFVIESINDRSIIPLRIFLKRMLGFEETDEEFSKFICTDSLYYWR